MSAIKIPKLSLVVLVGPSGSGKSTFAKKHFLPTEVISSDFCRGLISDDENDQSVTTAAFELLHEIAGKRLALGRLTVIDATNVQYEARRPLVALARKFHAIPVALVFDLPASVCRARNRSRSDRNLSDHVLGRQKAQLRRSLKSLKREGFRHIFIFRSQEEVEAARIERVPLWNDKREEHGPFDIIGDVHGCYDELEELLSRLGYEIRVSPDPDPLWGGIAAFHPEGRKAVFLGDLVDRGPRILDTLRLVRNMVVAGSALAVPGNHDMKFMRALKGKDVRITHGLDRSLLEISALPNETREDFKKAAAEFLHSLVSHYVLDEGRLVVAHAGMRREMQGRGSAKVRDFALYGETTGEIDEFGLPVRHNWAAEYRGPAMVVYGHTPVPEVEFLNRTINIDTGCVFGGKLTALRYPEKEIVSVPARRVYCPPAKPFLPEEEKSSRLTAQQVHDDLLDAEDVLGKRLVSTRLRSNVTIREENAAAALEVMSRFAANPKWIVYLPPTMSPCETASQQGYLEHPAEAFDHYRRIGIPRVVCQEKHMGSRAVVVICKDEKAAESRFGVTGEGTGKVYTRTGRPFFQDKELEETFLAGIRKAMDKAGFWREFQTDWACLDCELMPWSAKARDLLKTQYAAVGASGRASLSAAVQALEKTTAREDLEEDFSFPPGTSAAPARIREILDRYRKRTEALEKFIAAYRQYCWPVRSIEDYKLAPFHLMATESGVHADRDHLWHLEVLDRICAEGEGILLSTARLVVDVTDPESTRKGTKWWEELTGRGGEGMVVKPLEFIAKGKKGLAQPALKVRGREYLRIIYGPEYAEPDNLERLRSRSLGAKRSLALREFALGIEGLERFTRREPLRRVHECVFGVLALESEPVDPRL